MPLTRLLDRALQDSPDKPAVVFRDAVTTYRELDEASHRSAWRLRTLGIGHGDRVAIFMRNREVFVELYLACFRIGAIAVPLNHRFQTDEVVFAVTHCGAKLLVVDGPLLPVVEGIGDRAPSLTGTYVYGDETEGVGLRWDEVPADGAGDLPHVADEDPALILYTSGSTGRPKGVTHTHGSVVATAIGRGITQQLTADDISLAATAICHAGASVGVAFPTLHAGGTLVVLEESDPELFLEALRRWRPTRTVLLPTQLLDAVDAPGAVPADFASLREVECGGDQISPDLYERFAQVAQLQLNQLYGLTECEGATMNPPFGLIKKGSMGLPREGVQLRIARDDGGDAAAGEAGEIQLRGPSVMIGYWDDPKHTAATFADGWLRTGDLGTRDEDGYLHFHGRIKEVIIRGGSNIAPGEVEDVIDEHPAVELSGVVGVPDERLGAIVHAFVEFKPGRVHAPTADELAAFARQHLAAYKVPDRWTFVDALPRNAVGKIDRHALHEQATELDRA